MNSIYPHPTPEMSRKILPRVEGGSPVEHATKSKQEDPASKKVRNTIGGKPRSRLRRRKLTKQRRMCIAANAIVLPITGWLSAHLGRRNSR
jgi:hypothetical protein